MIDREHKSAMKWGMIAAAMYLAPDVYVLSAGNALPITAYVAIALLLVLTLFQLAWQLRGRLLERRCFPRDARDTAPLDRLHLAHQALNGGGILVRIQGHSMLECG